MASEDLLIRQGTLRILAKYDRILSEKCFYANRWLFLACGPRETWEKHQAPFAGPVEVGECYIGGI